ncbi:hypothetical protein M1310_01675 [Candidatus Marsarchaeota archaeon]|nr:hypothetical protein [Candidatus Marsarchaeota archaeon]
MEDIQFPTLPDIITWKGYGERLNSLKTSNIVVPIIFLNMNQSYKEAYQEAVLSYLFSLPISSIVLSGRCLEFVIRDKYNQIGCTKITLKSKKGEKKKDASKATLLQLISCKEFSSLGLDSDESTYVRILRNYIHNKKIVTLQTSLEAIHRVSEIINFLYPYETVPILIKCANCGQIHKHIVNSAEYLLANNLPLKCPNKAWAAPRIYKIGLEGVTP